MVTYCNEIRMNDLVPCDVSRPVMPFFWYICNTFVCYFQIDIHPLYILTTSYVPKHTIMN